MNKKRATKEEIVSYVFFGICTTVVNVVVYLALTRLLSVDTMAATAFAWFASVLFAYLTNRKWVFKKGASKKKEAALEIAAFFVCRFLTGLLDVAIMHIFADKMGYYDAIVKIVSNGVIIVANYILSKTIIFREDNKSQAIKNSLIVLALLAIGFLLAEQSAYGLWQNGFGSHDTNVYRTIGLEVKNGKMPYRDLFDHKGPLLYIIYTLGSFINDYRGVWVFSLISLTASTIFIYAITRKLKCSKPIALLTTVAVWTPALASGFLKNEDCCCTCVMALPFILASMYIFLDYFLTNTTSRVRLTMCGACFGASIMLRANMIAIWFVGCIAVLLMTLRKKQCREIVKYLSFFVAGALIVIIPILVWLGINNSLGAFIECYLGFNLQYSQRAVSPFADRILSAQYFLQKTIIALSFTYLIFRTIRFKMKEDYIFLSYFVMNIALITMAGLHYDHYGVAITPSLVYPLATFIQSMCKTKKARRGGKSDDYAHNIIVVLFGIYVMAPWIQLGGATIKIYESRNTGAYRIDSNFQKIVKTIRNNSSEDDAMQVFGAGWYGLYVHSGRSVATRYTFIPWTKSRNEIIEKFNSEVELASPKIIVLTSDRAGYTERMEKYVAANYELLLDTGKGQWVYKKNAGRPTD